MKKLVLVCTLLLVLPCMTLAQLPDTGQTKCYDDTDEITCPDPGEPFYGQDQYTTNPHSYTKLDENGDDLPPEATEWGLIIFMTVIMGTGIMVLRKRRMV